MTRMARDRAGFLPAFQPSRCSSWFSHVENITASYVTATVRFMMAPNKKSSSSSVHFFCITSAPTV